MPSILLVPAGTTAAGELRCREEHQKLSLQAVLSPFAFLVICVKNLLAGLLLTIVSLAACDPSPASPGSATGATTTGVISQGVDEQAFAPLPKPRPGEAVATFAEGCFWTTEHIFDALKGVRTAVSGYAGGTVANPTYEQVAGKGTGHAEAVQVYYDPKVIPYAQLVRVFFASHDPTTKDRQGPDQGDEYRSAVFYRTPAEKAAVEAEIARLTTARRYPAPIVTQVAPFTTFYPAENYHQGYALLHPENPYLRSVSQPRFARCAREFKEMLKPGAH